MAILHGNAASYFAEGLLADRPTPTNVAPHTVARYHATDNGNWYSWSGTAWQLESAAPPTSPSGVSTSDQACNIAGYLANSIIKEAMQQAIQAIAQGQTLLGYGMTIIGAIPGAGLIVNALIAALSGLYNAINGGTVADYQAAVADSALFSLLTCTIYVNTEADGGVTAGNFPGMVTAIGDITYTHADVITAIVSFLNSLGYAGVAQLQPVGALAVYDCTSCGSGISTGPPATPARSAAGTLSMTIAATTTSQTGTVHFDKPFGSTPIITATVGDPDVIVSISAKAVDQFTVVITCAVPAHADIVCQIDWYASWEGSV